MDLVFMSTFNDQSISIGCVGKLGHLSGFLRHYLLRIWCSFYKYLPMGESYAIGYQIKGMNIPLPDPWL